MTFPTEVADHHKANLIQRCVYLVAQFKGKSLELWQKFSEELKTLKPEDSWDFYHMLLVEYQKLGDSPAQTVKKAIKKQVSKAAKKLAPKKVAKKAAKKVTKKAAPKKAVKKAPAKKVAPKKAAKKVAAKKAPAKKTAAKKVVKKKKK